LYQAQTPQQRKANQKFAKEQTAKMGKPESAIKKKEKEFKSPVSPLWLGMYTPREIFQWSGVLTNIPQVCSLLSFSVVCYSSYSRDSS
jgi:hypothetical protein